MVDGEVRRWYHGLSIINPQLQLVWELRVGGQHAVNFFHLMGVLVSAKLKEELKALDFLLPLNYYYFVLLDT